MEGIGYSEFAPTACNISRYFSHEAKQRTRNVFDWVHDEPYNSREEAQGRETDPDVTDHKQRSVEGVEFFKLCLDAFLILESDKIFCTLSILCNLTLTPLI